MKVRAVFFFGEGGPIDNPATTVANYRCAPRTPGCTSWFDGCNTCAVVNGAIGGCTMMYCSTPAAAYCAEFGSASKPGSAPADGAGYGVGGQADGSTGFNCCGGGGACGYEHCPALGAGQEGCVQPWNMPDSMDFDTDCTAATVGGPAAAVSGACATVLAATQNVIGSYVPQCDAAGDYEPVQCHGSTGFCWCSDTSGNEVDNTRQRGPVSADTCAALTCDVARIQSACAQVDAADRANCGSECHTLSAQMLAACKTSVPQVASGLQEMVATCAGH
jgi:hypothetical protein